MACQALGRCRICDRRHRIAIFGGEEAQHFLIEKANLKLIILNTVCVVCIGKIENFVKKMDLDMVFNDYIKDEVIMRERDSNSAELKVASDDRDNSEAGRIKVEENENEGLGKSVENSTRLVPMDVGNGNIDCAMETEKKSKAADNKTTSSENCCNFSRDDVVTNETVADSHVGREDSGESQSAIISHCSNSADKIGHKNVELETMYDEPERKRPRNCPKVMLTGKRSIAAPNSKNATSADLDLSSVRTRSSASTFVNCGRSTDRLSSLAVRKSGRSLACDFCEKEFTHAGDLNKHRRKHTGEKPYECNECKRKFAHASNLARHQRVHSGERPFSCPKCRRTFTRRDKLTIHTTAERCLTARDNNIGNSPNRVSKRTAERTQS